MKKSYYLLIFSLLFLFQSCNFFKKEEPEPKPLILLDNSTALEWAQLNLDYINTVSPNLKSPTFISRFLGYTSLTFYESVVPANPSFQSIASSLNGLGSIPKPMDNLDYNYELVANAGQASIIKKLWNLGDTSIVDSLENKILLSKSIGLDSTIINRSTKLGKEIANSIYQWSLTDNGKNGGLVIYDTTYKIPEGEDKWVSPFGGQTSIRLPMHPYWGQNRNFLLENSEMEIPEMIPFSLDTTSACFQDFKELYDIQENLTQEQKEKAIWWSDDPTHTFSPPGHSYNIALTLLKNSNYDLVQTSAAFAKTGLAVAESFINCFRVKYHYNSLRPTAYIRKTIYRHFVQYWPEPPFPAFTSGHSTQAAAAATVLMSELNNDITFTDSTHASLPRSTFFLVEFKPQTFDSIWQFAEECGYSRLYGGIHSAQDNTVGLSEGKIIGENVNKLNWRK